MENKNFIPAETLDPRDAQIVELELELETVRAASQKVFANQEILSKTIMGVIGEKLEALIESYVDNVKDDVMDEFSIYDYQSEIDEMIGERLPDEEDNFSSYDDVKSLIKEVLAGSTLTLDIE
jgi:hypothetical protein